MLARRLWGARAGLLAGAVLAFDPRFIVETGAVYTETLFTCLLMAGLAAYVTAHQRASTRWYALAWVILGLAALARPIAVLIFPLLCLHLWLCLPRKQALRQTLLLGGLLALVLAPWAVRHYVLYGDLDLVGSSAASHFWLGAIRDGQWEGLQGFLDEKLAIAGGDPNNPPYLQAALAVIAENPLRFLQLLGLKLMRAYLQPMGTVFFAGPSLKAALLDVLAGRAGLGALLADFTFWPKLAMYIFHYGTIGLGLAGVWRSRGRWLEILPLILAVAGFSGVYMLLTMIPRYIFPIMPCFIVLAAEPMLALWRWRAAARSPSLAAGRLAPRRGEASETPYHEGRA